MPIQRLDRIYYHFNDFNFCPAFALLLGRTSSVVLDYMLNTDRSVFSDSLFDKPNSAIKCLGFRDYVNQFLLELQFDSGLVVRLTLVNTTDVTQTG